jgi:hypothetical protein
MTDTDGGMREEMRVCSQEISSIPKMKRDD